LNAPSSADLNNLSVVEARQRMAAAVAPTSAETVSLDHACGRVLAENVAAVRDQPPFDASAMDGWAVRQADLAPAAVLDIVGESAAGRGWAAPLAPGQTVRIFTGAPVPHGADRVVIQEEARRDGGRLHPAPQGDRRHVRPRGADFRAGDVLLTAGDAVDPWRLSLAAAAGRDRLEVRRRPVVAVLAGGDELAEPGTTPGPWQIFDSNAAGLCALVRLWGGEAVRLAAVRDDDEAIKAAVAAAQADLVVTVGGASVGDHDRVKPALAQMGLDLRVRTVAVRPGKPTWFGVLPDGGAVLGLPGNPASAFVCAELFLRPLVNAMLGCSPDPKPQTAALCGLLKPNGPREHWMRARTWTDDEGRLRAAPFDDQDSSLIRIFAQADALIMQPPGAGASEDGETVTILPLQRR
jgi:molybdopterin molybdotransferase